MFVKFKQLKFKNILSYGNVYETIDFETGLNVIKAPNGSGKSTILDALNYALFGKPFRNIKMDGLINRINGKQLVVEIEFQVGFDTWRIKRGEKPKILEIYKNGESVDKLSSKKLVQNEIDKLLGINQKLFKNIVGVAVTNNKPFLSMPIWEKRELIENIFNIDVLAEMAKEVKRRKTIEQTSAKLKVTESQSIDNQIADNRKYVENMQSYIDGFNEKKVNDKANMLQHIADCESKVKNNIKNIKIATDKLEALSEALSSKPDETIYAKTMKSLGIAENDKKRIQKTIDTLKDKPTCPLCGNDMNGEHAKSHMIELQSEIDKIIKETIPSLKKIESDYNTALEAYNKNVKLETVIKQKMREEEFSKNNLMADIDVSKSKLTEIENRVCTFDITEYKDKLDKLLESQKLLQTEIDDLKKQIELDTQLIDVLGDDGIKVYFFRKLIPIFNQNVNHYLKKFEMPIYIEFDEQMQETITNGRNEMEYDQFSGGEKTRIDMSVLLSFFNISRIISNWSCSLLFIDEVLDAQVDNNGIEQFVSTLNNIICENKNIGIYLVSHKLDNIKVALNSTVEISKKGLFSEINILR